MRTAIMGVGMVGGALAKFLDNPILYDPPKKLGSLEELNTADIIFVCVPTPYNKGFDISYVKDAVSKIKGKKIIVIKSTVVPGTTEKFQEKYPQHKILFNPEFLTEKNAEYEMGHPDRQIMGYAEGSYHTAEAIMRILPKAPFERIVPATEAEMIKYASNTFLALKVGYANQIYDLCKEIGIDYEKVRWGMGTDERIGQSHLDVWHEGKRGYDGKCLPKDSKSLLQLAKKRKVNFSIVKSLDKYNDKLWKE